MKEKAHSIARGAADFDTPDALIAGMRAKGEIPELDYAILYTKKEIFEISFEKGAHEVRKSCSKSKLIDTWSDVLMIERENQKIQAIRSEMFLMTFIDVKLPKKVKGKNNHNGMD